MINDNIEISPALDIPVHFALRSSSFSASCTLLSSFLPLVHSFTLLSSRAAIGAEALNVSHTFLLCMNAVTKPFYEMVKVGRVRSGEHYSVSGVFFFFFSEIGSSPFSST